MRGKKVEVLVPTLMIVALVIASLITVVEEGPPRLGLPVGASPLNTGKLGTTKMLSIIKSKFTNVRVVRDWRVVNETMNSCDEVLIVTVSPEKPFTTEELNSIDSLIRKCSAVSFLIADETGNTNALLERAGLNSRIDGRILLQASSNITSIMKESPSNVNISMNYFVEALFNYPNGYTDKLYLDKASFIQVKPGETNVSILGVTTNYVIITQSGSSGLEETYIDYYMQRAIIAALERSSRFKALIISDGSIFTNQVLSNEVWGLKYERLLRESLNLLTNNTSAIVLVDSSKYEYFDMSSNPALLAYADPLELSLYTILKLIHPASWFTPLVSYVNTVISRFLDSLGLPLLVFLTLILGALLTAQLMKSSPEIMEDRPIEETKSREFVIFSSLANEVISGRVSLGKQDFIELYEIVDEILKSSVGAPLNSKEVVNILVSRGVDPKKAKKFWSSMNKTYSKAKKKFGFPPILMWGRKVKKSIVICEEILNVLGTSLLRDLGFEYLLAQR